jgi:hypothetical protein
MAWHSFNSSPAHSRRKVHAHRRPNERTNGAVPFFEAWPRTVFIDTVGAFAPHNKSCCNCDKSVAECEIELALAHLMIVGSLFSAPPRRVHNYFPSCHWPLWGRFPCDALSCKIWRSQAWLYVGRYIRTPLICFTRLFCRGGSNSRAEILKSGQLMAIIEHKGLSNALPNEVQ